jgi:hypothetical protein
MIIHRSFYPPSQNTTGMPVDECAICFGAMFAPKTKADNRGVASGEDGYFYGTTGSPVGLHRVSINYKSNDCRPITVPLSSSQLTRSLCGRKNDACVHNHGPVFVREYRVHVDFFNFRCRIDEVRKFQKHLL